MREKWKKISRMLICLAGTLVLLAANPAVAADELNYMTPEELKIRLDTNEPTILVDIQKKNAYLEHHFYGSISTYAYPAITELDTQNLAQVVGLFEQTRNVVVIIGPRGGKASRRTLDYLVSRGIPAEKIYILQGGIKGWPYREMLLNIQGGCG